MKRAIFALLIALAVPTAALSAPAEKKQEKQDAKHDPENVYALSEYMETVVKGADFYKKGDHTAAIDSFKKAISLSPKNPLGHLLLGEAYLAKNNLPEAEAAFLAAQEASTSDPKGHVLRSHVLFAVADVYERQKKWNEAKAAWQAYLEQASKLSADSGAHPSSGIARKEQVEKVIEREKVYAVVRERIAAEKDGGAKADAAAAKK